MFRKSSTDYYDVTRYNVILSWIVGVVFGNQKSNEISLDA